MLTLDTKTFGRPYVERPMLLDVLPKSLHDMTKCTKETYKKQQHQFPTTTPKKTTAPIITSTWGELYPTMWQ